MSPCFAHAKNPEQFQTLTSMKATIREPTITTLAFRVAQSNREKERPPLAVNLSMSRAAAQGKASIAWVPSLPTTACHRITGWFGLDVTLKTIQFQPPAMVRNAIH